MSCITNAVPTEVVRNVKRAVRELTTRPDSERGLENGFIQRLGTSSQRQVKTPFGIIDVLTDDTIYELKANLTLRELHTAIGQLKLYQLAYPDRTLCIVTLRVSLADVVIVGVLQELGIDILVANWETYDGQED